jgi:hypothetical protein
MQILWMQFENQPPAVHFLVTTFKERPEITEAVLESIFAECRAARVSARIFVATGDASDECVVEDYCSRAVDVPAKLIIVRQSE